MARLKELEDENRRLKKMYAEERLKAEIITEAMAKVVTPSARREMATKAVTHYAISIRLACRIFKVSESCYRYQPVLVDENQEIADWLLRITASQRNWGFGLCFCTCATSKALAGITNGYTGSIGRWSSICG